MGTFKKLFWITVFLLLVFITIRAASAAVSDDPADYVVFDDFNRADNTSFGVTQTGQSWVKGAFVNANAGIEGNKAKMLGTGAYVDTRSLLYVTYPATTAVRGVWYKNIQVNHTGTVYMRHVAGNNNYCEIRFITGTFKYINAAGGVTDSGIPYTLNTKYNITILYNSTSDKALYRVKNATVDWSSGWVDEHESQTGTIWSIAMNDNAVTKATIESARVFNGTELPIAVVLDNLNITEITPAPPKAQYNTNPVNVWALGNASTNWTCRLYINGAVNQTLQLGTGNNINCSFNLTLLVGEWNVSIRGNTSTIDKNTSTTTIYFDNVAPVIASTTFVNNSIIYPGTGNLTANWSITDNFYLYRVTSWINGNLINNITQINATTYNYTMNTSITGLSPGSHTLTIQVADGHTAQSITTDSYDWSNGLFNDYLRFNFKQPYNPVNVRLENKDGSWLDSWKATPQKDRYVFSYEPWSIKSTYVINVISESKISILQHGGLNWLVFDNHWIDFEPYKVSYKRISPYEVQAIIQNPKLDSKLEFNSIGDLNIITRNYTFITTNLSVTYANPVNEAYTQTISLRIERNNTGITNTQAALYWNGTSIPVTKYSCCPEAPGIYDLYSGTFTTPLITSDPSEVFNFTWYYNVTHPINNLTGNITLNQTVYRIGIDNCTTYTIRAVNITTRAENNNSPVNSDIAGYFEVWINQTSQYRAFNLTWAGNSTYGICINRNVTYRLNGQMEYEAPSYATKTYFLNNYALNNITSILNLYFTLNTTQVILYVTDQNDDPVKNVYIHVQSYDVGTNSYKTTEIVKTDFEGRAFAQLIMNTQWYQFMLAYNGVTVLQTDATKIVNTFLNFQINLEAATLQAWTKYNQISCGVTFNNITKNFRMDFNNPSSEPITALLTVYNSSRFSRKILGTNNITAASGTLLVNIGATTANNTFTGQGLITIDGQQFPCGTPASIGFNQDFQVWGLQGIFYAILIIIAITTAFIWGPEISVIATLVAIGGLWMFGIIGLSAPVIMTILILGGIIVYRLTRK